MVLKTTLMVLFTLPLTLTSTQHGDIHGMERAAREAEVQESNFKDLLENNEEFQNLTKLGVPHTRVFGVISAVSTGFSLLNGIADQIDLSRVCVIGLANNGNRKLIQPTWYLDHGTIQHPLPREIAPNAAGVFTFEKTAYAPFGTAGMLTYTVDGTDLQILVMWSVPMVDDNRFNIAIATQAITASASFYNFLYYNNFQEVSNDGHWMQRSGENIDIHAAMTNSGKASLLVEVYYNLTPTETNIFGK